MASTAQPEEKENNKSTKRLFSNGIWAYKTIFQLDPWGSVALIGIPILTAVIPTIIAFYSGRFIDQLIRLVNDKVGISGLDWNNPLLLTTYTIASIELLLYLLNNINRFADQRFRIFSHNRFRIELYKRIASLNVAQYENSKIANSIQKGLENSYKLRVYVDSSRNLLNQFVVLAVAATICFRTSPLITLIIFLFTIPGNFIYAKYVKKIWDYYNNSIEEDRKRGWLLSYLNSDKAAVEHQITKANQSLLKEATSITQSLNNREIQSRLYRLRMSGPLGIINIFYYLVPVVYLIGEVLKGRFTVGQFSFLRGRFSDFSSNTDGLLSTYIELTDPSSYLNQVRYLWEIKPEIISGNTKLISSKPPKIELINLSFKYPGTDKLVLRNINLTINPGDEIALVGVNGAGKTTLIKLLLRYYEPTKGKILINGTNLKHIKLDDYYRIFGALFQEYNTYGALNVKDNIHLGDYCRTLSQSEVESAAIKAEATTFINDLPNKYQQKLNRQFSGGTNLSTGQW